MRWNIVKSLKIISLFAVGLIVSSLLVPGCIVNVVAEDFSTKDKLVALVEDVFGLDLSKYNIIDESSNTRYDYGGVQGDVYRFSLVDARGGLLTVVGQCYKGFPHWVNISPKHGGALYYTITPPTGSSEKMKRLFERYEDFAQKYGIATMNGSLALALLDKTPHSIPKDTMPPASVTLDDLTLYVQQNSFSFVYTFDGVGIPNKSWTISFTDNKITFADTFELYTVYNLHVFSKEEITRYAFELAKRYGDSLFTQSGVKPDWPNVRSEVVLGLIPGKSYNYELNKEFLDVAVIAKSHADRDAFTLYPFWSVNFYFSQPIDNIYGIKISLWGDTEEVAYFYKFGLDSMPTSPGGSSVEASPYGDLLPLVTVVLIALVIAITIVVISAKKKYKKSV
jgi:hypothetical protein